MASSKTDIARWALSGSCLVGAAVVTAVSSFSAHLRVCIAEASGGPQKCEPLGFDDPFLVSIVILAIFFLLPDLSKVKIGGLVELERIVEETKSEVGAVKDEVSSLRQDVHLNQRAEARSDVNLILAPDLVQGLSLSHLEEKARSARVID